MTGVTPDDFTPIDANGLANVDPEFAKALKEWEANREFLRDDDIAPTPEHLYGRKADGKPYTRSPAVRARIKRNNKKARKGADNSSSGSSGGKTRTTSGGYDADAIGERLVDALGAITGGLALLAHQMKSPPLQADSIALAMHGPAVAREVARLGEIHPELARTLALLSTAGPYTALLGAALPLVIQMGVNHGLVPVQAGAQMGAKSPEQLITDYDAMVRAAYAPQN